jgi:hypothetical protein
LWEGGSLNTIEELDKLSTSLCKRDAERNDDFEMYDNMDHNYWKLPDSLEEKQWIFSILSTEPADKLNAATRIMARLEPKLKLLPLYNNPNSRDKANDIETTLLWNLWSASRRRPVTVWWDYMRSSLLYHMVAAQVVDIDYQITQNKMFEADTTRLEAAKQYGRFMINIHNPRNVHPRYSNVMAEGVLLEHTKTAFEVYKEFGPVLASGLKGLAEDLEKINYVVVRDWTDYKQRAIWCYQKDGAPDKDRIVILEPTENQLPFMNWVVRAGGSTLEDDEREKYRPLLYTVLRAGQWDIANVVESLITSKAIAKSGAPDIAEEGMNPVITTEINYDSPVEKIDVSSGNTLRPINLNPIDMALLEQRNYVKEKMNSTLPVVLTTLQPESGEAYASFSLRFASALGVLAPFTKLAEDATAETAEKMLLWSYHTKNSLSAFGRGKSDYGKQYTVPWDEIEPEQIYITCEYRPDTPTDKIGKINAGQMAVVGLGASKEWALEEIGVENPNMILEQRMYEQLVENKLAIIMQKEQAMAQLEIQQMQAEIQQGMQQAQADAQMQMQQLQGMGNPQGIPGAEGQEFNPAMGGMIPQEMMPEATYEGQTGRYRTGEEQARELP